MDLKSDLKNDFIVIKDSLRANFSKILLLFTSLLLIFQFSFFIYNLSNNVDSWPVIYAKDNDAANAIRVAERTNWLNDNQYYNYGNLYFRLTHSIEKMNPFLSGKTIEPNSPVSDKSHHFTMMLISLICIFAISYLIAAAFTDLLIYQLASVFVLNIIFMKNEFWIDKIFGVHPDLLLCFLVSLSTFLTVKYLSSDKKSLYFILSAISWGTALATKLSALFYFPFLILLFIPKINKENIIQIIKYYSIIFITYFVIGFPQNFDLLNTYNFLKYQSSYSISPTTESFLEWWVLLGRQSIYLVLLIIALSLLFSRSVNSNQTKINYFRIIMVVCFPFIMLLSRKITSPYQHYSLPIAAGMLVFFSFYMAELKTKIFSKKEIISDENGYTKQKLAFFSPNLRVIAALVFGLIIFRFTSNSIPGILAEQLHCRKEAGNVFQIISDFQDKKKIIQVDPYVAFDPEKGYVSSSWFRTFADIKPGNAHVLVFSKKYYIRYIEGKEPGHYVKQYSENWPEIRKFYLTFSEKSTVTDPFGQKWHKIYSDNCQWEVWVLSNLGQS